MAVYVAPGVYVREIDLSLYLPSLSTTIVGMVGRATRGPVNERTYITSQQQFVDTFGRPDSAVGFESYAALQYLRRGRQLWYVRIVGPAAVSASANFAGTDTDSVAAEIIDAGTGTQRSFSGTFVEFPVVPYSIAITATVSAAPVAITDTGAGVLTGANVAGSIDYATGAWSLLFSVGEEPDNATNITANYDYYLPSAEITGEVVGTGTTGGTLVFSGTLDHFPVTPSSFSATTVCGVNTVVGLDNGAGVISGTGVTGTIVYATGVWALTYTVAPDALEDILADYTWEITDEVVGVGTPGGETHFTGTLVEFPINPGSLIITATVVFPAIVTATDQGDGTLTGVGVTSATIDYVTGDYDIVYAVAPDDATDIEADYTGVTLDEAIDTGTAGGQTVFPITFDHIPVAPGTITITSGAVSGTDNGLGVITGAGITGTVTSYTLGTASVTFTVAPGVGVPVTADYRYSQTLFTVSATSEGEWGNDLSVTISNGRDQDTFKMTVYQEDIVVDRYDNLVLDPASDDYIETRINDISDYIEVDVAVGAVAGDYPVWVTATPLTGGDSDAANVAAADVIGLPFDPVLSQATGLQLFASSSAVDINLLAAPGWSEAAIVTEMLSICEARADCMAVIDPPETLSPQEVVDWHNGQGIWVGDHAAFNSSYGALYWSWVKIYDAYTREYVFTPPSGHVLAVYAYNDQVAESWYAPAGLNRGRVVSGIELEYDPTQGDLELLYGDGNSVNPIERFTQDGLVVWGQRTLQRTPTALDRVNVRRLLLYIRKAVATATRALVFEPNDEKTWRQFGHMVTPFLNDLTQRRGLYDFRVKCDESTNTPDVIDRNELRAQILIKPVKAAEFIDIAVVITTTGANFEEIAY